MVCPLCGHNCSLRADFRFVCGKTNTVKGSKCIKKTRCAFSVSGRSGTWFAKSKLSIADICMFTIYWCDLVPPRYTFLANEMGMPSNTIVDWSSFCREV